MLIFYLICKFGVKKSRNFSGLFSRTLVLVLLGLVLALAVILIVLLVLLVVLLIVAMILIAVLLLHRICSFFVYSRP